MSNLLTKLEIKERNELFCELLSETGDIRATADQVGVSVRTARKIVAKMSDYMLEIANSEIAAMSYKAIRGLNNALNEDGSVPKADIRLKAATEILDRMGASKQPIQQVELKQAGSPIILMPAKELPAARPLILVDPADEA